MNSLAALNVIARGGHNGGGGFLFLLLFLLLFGFLARGVVRRKRGMGGHGSPVTTLQDRFARGEINQDEFQHRIAVLKNKKDIPPAPARTAPPAPAAFEDTDDTEDEE